MANNSDSCRPILFLSFFGLSDFYAHGDVVWCGGTLGWTIHIMAIDGTLAQQIIL